VFTGIITHLGTVRSVHPTAGGLCIAIAADVGLLPLGASIACSGVCLTVIASDARSFAADVSAETLSKTTVGDWSVGRRINLERPLKVGDELGGHFVLGHVDGVATVTERRPDGESIRMTIAAPAALARYFAPKGSVTLEGVALTVNEVAGNSFGVNIIPHTEAVTTLGAAGAGTRLNLEVDPLARYVARLAEVPLAPKSE
jgi:riboflavin synthase